MAYINLYRVIIIKRIFSSIDNILLMFYNNIFVFFYILFYSCYQLQSSLRTELHWLGWCPEIMHNQTLVSISHFVLILQFLDISVLKERMVIFHMKKLGVIFNYKKIFILVLSLWGIFKWALGFFTIKAFVHHKNRNLF